jgi:AbrB family looped-hinge helix DNA binding protein
MSIEINEMAKMSSKGQITVPAPIRDILSLKTGSTVIFKVTDIGVFFVPCEIKEKNSYTQEEWTRIERLVAERGKAYKTARGARKHLKSL